MVSTNSPVASQGITIRNGGITFVVIGKYGRNNWVVSRAGGDSAENGRSKQEELLEKQERAYLSRRKSKRSKDGHLGEAVAAA